ncbi:hypothetical protein HAX54_030627 [Datura stramonium]|uniref:Uncharacterized protein n=1 Tax=Datura stramonium TaxID=4076 RepID=A0ABS8VAR1_DATST|nr:hypothetical protein [Datura stramonium]
MPPVPVLRIVPNGVVGPHANPIRNRPVLPMLLRQLLLDHESLVGRKDSKKLAPCPVFRVQFKTKRSYTKFKHKSKSRHTFKYNKESTPVYIDQLFLENISVVKENVAQTTKDHKHDVLVTETEQAEIHQGESSSVTNGHENYSNDEMWESLTLASPQLHCINERAEEFITRFRAGMRLQENLFTHPL